MFYDLIRNQLDYNLVTDAVRFTTINRSKMTVFRFLLCILFKGRVVCGAEVGSASAGREGY